MVATLLHPSAVPITIPSTSPMAHPVRQCSVAEKAVRLSELFQVAINILTVRMCRYHCIPAGGICKGGDWASRGYRDERCILSSPCAAFAGWSAAGGPYTRLWCEI